MVSPTVGGVRSCTSCGGALHDGDAFCEACGARTAAPHAPAGAVVDPAGADEHASDALTTAASGADPSDAGRSAAPGGAAQCRACGGPIAADGYCERCGEPAASARDHWSEQPAPWVGGVCDRGVRHVRNEDALALAASGAFAALVVCDGVSTAPRSDVASLAAAAAARDVLAAAGPDGTAPVVGTEPARTAAWSALLGRASRAGNAAVVATMQPGLGPEDVPSCTFVAAVLDGPLLVAGWLGDSRVYWLPDEGPAEQLTADDSGAGELVSRGVPREAAEASPQAHAITRWLGPDADDATARTTATVLDGPGWVLVCSDGLWNYCSPAGDLAILVREHARDLDPVRTADALVAWANAQGGRDNVTVALARFG